MFNVITRKSGCRWFLRYGPRTYFDSRGFRTKDEASAWIASHGDRIDWRAGFVFRLRGAEHDCAIVSRKGVEAKA
jgi:hypothetical protein